MAMRLDGQRIGVLGLGRSGISAARLIHRLGGTALISERKQEAECGEIPSRLRVEGINLEFSGHTRLLSEDFCTIIVSPGAVLRDEWLAEWSRRGIEVWSELELASRCYDGRWIAVTGSNGKTTTVTLIAGMLRAAGLRVETVGNIGTAWSEYLPARDVDIFVVEVSSFQMEHTHTAKPDVAVILNVLENHLDRHGDLETYGKLKLKLCSKQDERDFVVLNSDDDFLRTHTNSLPQRTTWFGHTHESRWKVEDSTVMLVESGKVHEVLRHTEWKLPGEHNLLNAAAASAAAEAVGVSIESIRNGLLAATPVEHRIEFVRELNKVRYYNDSKSTNLTATLTAIAAVQGQITLLFGGRPKQESFTPLAKLVGNRLAHLIVFGEATAKVKSEVHGVPVIYCENIEEALSAARELTTAGSVLLSPGCASYDQFTNFEERGAIFKALVENLS